MNNLSVIRQKSVSGGKNIRFLQTFVVLCFLVTPVLRFTLLPYCQRTHTSWRHVFKETLGLQTFQQCLHPLLDFSVAKED